jgi:hypothetical protein
MGSLCVHDGVFNALWMVVVGYSIHVGLSWLMEHFADEHDLLTC